MFNENFYPTPENLIRKMMSKIDFKNVKTVLEPSAGKADIAEAVRNKIKENIGYYNRDKVADIDTIEIDTNLQHILKGKNFRVVHNDFLTYNTFKKYNLIIMNPPFAEGDKHLLKAIDMQVQGGQIVCILNAETLNNPYSNTRKDLIRKLEEYNAEVEFIENAFTDAERKTSVEIALIYINISDSQKESIIISKLKQEEQYNKQNEYNSRQIIAGDYLQGIVDQYNFEIQVGLRLINEYNSLKPLMLNSLIEESYKSPILELKLTHRDDSETTQDGYIRQIRMKYWKALFSSKEFTGLFTNNLRYEYQNKVNELADYDFSLYNIYSIRTEMSQHLVKAIEDTILSLFEEFSHKHYYEESSKNVHYYNGWKTNKAWKINKKVIIPLNGFGGWNGKLEYNFKVKDKLSDIEKVFNYLDGGITETINLEEIIKTAQSKGETKKIELKYFYVTFFKKGTCHIEFKNMDLLHKFNLFGSQRKGWIPPSYGHKQYKDMTTEEKTVIDEFEGKESYNKVMNNKEYFITETSQLLRLTHSA